MFKINGSNRYNVNVACNNLQKVIFYNLSNSNPPTFKVHSSGTEKAKTNMCVEMIL